MSLTLPLTGGCLCGEVRYEVREQPYMVTACHCTICQKRTGSAFAMNMMTPRAGFAITQGNTVTRERATSSGKVSLQHFCDNCMVRTHTEPEWPGLVFVRPGTLDDPNAVKVIAQLWTSSGRPEALIPDVAAFPENLVDGDSFVEKWRTAHPVA